MGEMAPIVMDGQDEELPSLVVNDNEELSAVVIGDSEELSSIDLEDSIEMSPLETSAVLTSAVISVNGKTGAVVLDASDVGAASVTALNTKVDKVPGKGLSTNDFTNAEKSKLAGVETGAQKNVQSDWKQANVNADSYIRGKPTALSDFDDDIGAVSESIDNVTIMTIFNRIFR